jgi:hypothetical protein
MLKASDAVRLSRTIQIRNQDGTGEIAVSLDAAGLSEDDQKTLSDILKAGSLDHLTSDRQAELERKRFTIDADASGPIIRFDLKVVRIDKQNSLDLLELVARG